MSKFRKGSALVVLVALVALAAAVSAFGGSRSDRDDGSGDGRQAAELKFTLSKKTIAEGHQHLQGDEQGHVRHDFKIAGKKTVSLGAGKAATLRVTFTKAGRSRTCARVPATPRGA